MFKDVSKGIVITFWAVLCIFALCVGVWYFQVRTSDIKGRGDAEIQINSADNRIATYNHFFDLCVSVKDAEVGIDSTTQQLQTTSDPRTKDRLNTNLTALQVTRAQGINQYNSDSLKGYTDARFKAMNLPYQLSDEPYVAGGEKTQCAS